MSSNHDPNLSEQSPQHNDASSAAKRRRLALACLDCRRRKLKCDRVFPACTRCQKGGHSDTCTYDPDAVETVAAPFFMDRPRANGNRDMTTADSTAASRATATPTSFVHHHQLDTDDSTIGRMQLHVHQLENRIMGLERATNGPHPWAESSRSDAIPKIHHFGDPNLPESEDKELMMFRGKDFKTSFYGASHHTSYLSHVR